MYVGAILTHCNCISHTCDLEDTDVHVLIISKFILEKKGVTEWTVGWTESEHGSPDSHEYLDST